MERKLEVLKKVMMTHSESWLVTGAAGFIGSNLVEFLLSHNQTVIGLDNLSTGYLRNLEDVRKIIGDEKWRNFTFIEGDIQDFLLCKNTLKGVDRVLHQAALGSVPRSIYDPIASNASNVTGFLNILKASQEEGVKSFVYAASSSTYGDHKELPKVEENIGRPLSPYAVTKYVNELYANVFINSYGFKSVGLRYFNVFGKRQDPYGAYAAVIPLWVYSMIEDKEIFINGDGDTSRDFCFVENAVEANILASFADDSAKGEVYNIAFGGRTTLNDLLLYIKETLKVHGITYNREPLFRNFREGDVRHSLANISKAAQLLGYAPIYSLSDGLKKDMSWYVKNLS